MTTLEDYRIQKVLNRLMEIIEYENSHLKCYKQFDINASNDHKGRCLHELSVLLNSCKGISYTHAEQVRILHNNLELNATLLESYLVAARAVSDLFKRKLQDIDADGTYSKR